MTIHKHDETNTQWFIRDKELIYGKLHNLQFTTTMSVTIDALVKTGCSTNQIYMFFQNIGINIYEDHIKLYLKYGITLKEEVIELM